MELHILKKYPIYYECCIYNFLSHFLQTGFNLLVNRNWTFIFLLQSISLIIMESNHLHVNFEIQSPISQFISLVTFPNY